MALIKCSECGREISDKAPTCPGCGNPINGGVQIKEKVVVIEQTGKTWKGLQLVFGFMFWLGLFMLIGSGNDQAMKAPANIFFTFGLIGWIVGKIGTWWNHR
jgi:hypothetical protein